MKYRWRPLQETDLADVAAIAAFAFPDHFEESARFAERLVLNPDWCFGLEDGAQTLVGYLIAYPWPLGSIPPLNEPLGFNSEDASALFLHDLAICPRAAGTRQAAAAIDMIADRAAARGYTDIALVAVNNTAGFWCKFGFANQSDTTEALRVKLASYGEEARYMRRDTRIS